MADQLGDLTDEGDSLAADNRPGPRSLIWWVCTIAAIGPVGWFVAFGSLILKARLVKGAWPVPYVPDPGTIGGPLYPIVFAALPLTALLGPAYVVGLTVGWAVPRCRRALRTEGVQVWHILLPAVGITAMWIFMSLNPWRLFTWLAD